MTRAADVRRRVLNAVAQQDITVRYGKRRWWTSEHAYRAVSQAEKGHLKRLLDEGMIKYEGAAGYSHTMIGYYVLTRQGRDALTAGGS